MRATVSKRQVSSAAPWKGNIFCFGQQHQKESKDSLCAVYLCPLSTVIRLWITFLCGKIRRTEYRSVEVSIPASYFEGLGFESSLRDRPHTDRIFMCLSLQLWKYSPPVDVTTDYQVLTSMVIGLITFPQYRLQHSVIRVLLPEKWLWPL